MKKIKQLTTTTGSSFGSSLGWGMLVCGMLLLAGCTKQEADDNWLPEGKYPLIFTATKDDSGAVTRVAGKDAWTVGDEIGVKIGSGTAGAYKITAIDGSTMEAITPLYWQSTASATVTAWYPKDAQDNVSLTNQSASGFTDVDFLKAETTGTYNQSNLNLSFKHLLAKVKVNLISTNGKTDLGDAEVSILGNTAFSYTEGVITGNGNNDYITPHKDDDGSYEALLVPQNNSNAKFVRIKLKNRKEYYYTPSSINLAGGSLHTYTITVNDEPIIVNLADISDDTYTAKWDCTINGDVNTIYQKNIIIEDGVTVTINNVNLKPSTTTHAISGNGTATLILQGTNTLTGNSAYYAGVHAVTKITIKGNGSLTAIGGENAPGIGGGLYTTCGDIYIEGGTIISNGTAGGSSGAGIGSHCGNITITGGTVTATGAGTGSGIGSGYGQYCGNITISGGTVVAVKGNGASNSIGAGNSGSCGTITIDRDNANVTEK